MSNRVFVISLGTILVLFAGSLIQLLRYKRENLNLKGQLGSIESKLSKLSPTQTELTRDLNGKADQINSDHRRLPNQEGIIQTTSLGKSEHQRKESLSTDLVEKKIEDVSKEYSRYFKRFIALEMIQNQQRPSDYHQLLIDEAAEYLKLSAHQKEALNRIVNELLDAHGRLYKGYKRSIDRLRKLRSRKSKAEIAQLAKQRLQQERKLFKDAQRSIRQLLSQDRLRHKIFTEFAQHWLKRFFYQLPWDRDIWPCQVNDLIVKIFLSSSNVYDLLSKFYGKYRK